MLDDAVAMSRTPVEVSDALFAALRAHVDEAQVVEITHGIALEPMRGRFNLALGIARRASARAVCAQYPHPSFLWQPKARPRAHARARYRVTIRVRDARCEREPRPEGNTV